MVSRPHKRRATIKKLAPPIYAAFAAMVMVGCMVGPNYHRPAVQTPGVFRDLSENPQAQVQAAASFADLRWWQVFQDPQLQELIRTALKENYDLQIGDGAHQRCACSGHYHALQFISPGAGER